MLEAYMERRGRSTAFGLNCGITSMGCGGRTHPVSVRPPPLCMPRSRSHAPPSMPSTPPKITRGAYLLFAPCAYTSPMAAPTAASEIELRVSMCPV